MMMHYEFRTTKVTTSPTPTLTEVPEDILKLFIKLNYLFIFAHEG